MKDENIYQMCNKYRLNRITIIIIIIIIITTWMTYVGE